MNSTNDLLKRIALGLFGLSLMAYGLWPRNEESTATRTRTRNAASVGSGAKAITPPLVKIPIKDMRVGTRVPAFNPEVSAAERRQFTEPNWYRWMKLKLEMPKPDGTTLEIEMLRSEDWIIQQLALIVEPETSNLVDRSVEAAANGASAITINENSGIASTDSTVASDSPIGSAWVPLRPIYFHLADLLTDAASDGDRVLGMIVELDLPELGLTGPAWVIDLEPAPIIPAGPGQVVTATFKHASASVLDLVLTSSPPATLPVSTSKLSATPSTLSAMPADLDPITESIGVTANHPFWSVDRAEFVQAGELTIGERLQTLAGDTVWVQQKLPRPGPEPVYNLEVHVEHVYYVGEGGVLVHNSQNYAPNTGSVYKTWNQFQSGTAGQFASRAEAVAAWNAYKQAKGIVTGTSRSAAARRNFLKGLTDDFTTPSWMKQWLTKGKTPPFYDVDHILPLSVGGLDVAANMRLQLRELHRIHHRYFRPWE